MKDLTLPDKTHLMQWFLPWLDEFEESDLIFKDAASRQIQWVRDYLSSLIQVPYANRADVELTHRQEGHTYTCKESAWVVGEHRSKSVRLPVYAWERADLGLRMMLRGNFYNWKISVLSERPVEGPFECLFTTTPPPEPDYTGDDLHPVYFEGFPREWCFRYYSKNRRQWSAQIGSREQLWTVVYLVMVGLDALRPYRYHTRELHRAELNRPLIQKKAATKLPDRAR